MLEAKAFFLTSRAGASIRQSHINKNAGRATNIVARPALCSVRKKEIRIAVSEKASASGERPDLRRLHLPEPRLETVVQAVAELLTQRGALLAVHDPHRKQNGVCRVQIDHKEVRKLKHKEKIGNLVHCLIGV